MIGEEAMQARRSPGTMHRLAAAALATLSLAGPLRAAEGDNPDAMAGSLKIVQLWIEDAERFEREWAQPTPPHITTTARYERNQRADQVILFANCQADAAGKCRLSAKVDIVAPDGTAYGEPMVFPLWDNQPAPPRNVLVRTPVSIGLVVEDGEQLGPYRIALAVTDENTGLTATSRVTLTVVEQGAAVPPQEP
jgi:hypothetical protein